MSICACPGCYQISTNRCSACQKEPYCSSVCQKTDWKDHKKICKILKRLSNQLEPYDQVKQMIIETFNVKNSKVLEHAIIYAEFQFGNRLPGRDYRERQNGQKITNFEVEIAILFPLYSEIIDIYSGDISLSQLKQDNMMFPYVEKSLNLVRSWFESKVNNRIESFDKDQMSTLSRLLAKKEEKMAIIYMNRSEFDVSENHCQLALSYVNRYEGEEEIKAITLFEVLTTYCNLQKFRGNYIEALQLAEEAYNIVAIAYNPVHPSVQEAASTLIECLLHKGDLTNAEAYAQVTLDSLKDPMNGVCQESMEVARGHYDLANVIIRIKGDIAKAELLAREALRINSLVYGIDHHHLGCNLNLLARILMQQGKLGDETKKMNERALVSYIIDEGPDANNCAVAYNHLAGFHSKLAVQQLTYEKAKENLILSKSYYQESVRIHTKRYGPAHQITLEAVSHVESISASRQRLEECQQRCIGPLEEGGV
jgi:hypothetical protein